MRSILSASASFGHTTFLVAKFPTLSLVNLNVSVVVPFCDTNCKVTSNPFGNISSQSNCAFFNPFASLILIFVLKPSSVPVGLPWKVLVPVVDFATLIFLVFAFSVFKLKMILSPFTFPSSSCLLLAPSSFPLEIEAAKLGLTRVVNNIMKARISEIAFLVSFILPPYNPIK